jgi:enoyl-CoA hydratase/carnithine racemase
MKIKANYRRHSPPRALRRVAAAPGVFMGEVRIESEGDILTVTLADVENRNALGAVVVNGLCDALERANADPALRAVVVTNEGSTFCAGANLKEQSGAARGARPGVGFEELLALIQRSPTPVIGKIRGHVVGGGNGLAAAVDIAIAADDVKFGFTEVRLGGPNALAFAKRLVYEVPAMDTKDAYAWTAEQSAKLFKGEEAAAGMKAFLTRQKPPWAAAETD